MASFGTYCTRAFVMVHNSDWVLCSATLTEQIDFCFNKYTKILGRCQMSDCNFRLCVKQNEWCRMNVEIKVVQVDNPLEVTGGKMTQDKKISDNSGST